MLSDFIQIPREMLIPGNDLLSLLRNAFTEIVSHVGDADYFTVRVILTAKNKKCQSHQWHNLRLYPTHKISYLSTDQVCEDESQLPLPVEILNTIENGSLPPHFLDLKIGVPIMMIRDIDPAAGICNRTRLIVTSSLGTTVIEDVIAIGPHAGNIALIPKIKFISLATEGVSPLQWP